MNYSTAVFLINKNVRAVSATYEEGEKAGRTIFKTLDAGLAVGDFAIVPTDTRHKMTVVKIVDIDVDVDFDSSAQMQWIIGSVNRHDYEQITMQESQAIAAIKSAELRKKQDDLRAALLIDQQAIKMLAISSVGDTPAPTT